MAQVLDKPEEELPKVANWNCQGLIEDQDGRVEWLNGRGTKRLLGLCLCFVPVPVLGPAHATRMQRECNVLELEVSGDWCTARHSLGGSRKGV